MEHMFECLKWQTGTLLGMLSLNHKQWTGIFMGMCSFFIPKHVRLVKIKGKDF
jgi:hypothetical protein